MHITASSLLNATATFTQNRFSKFAEDAASELAKLDNEQSPFSADKNPKDCLNALLQLHAVKSLLQDASRTAVFHETIAAEFSTDYAGLTDLRSLKLLKYCYNIPCGQLASVLAKLIVNHGEASAAKPWQELADQILEDSELGPLLSKHVLIGDQSVPDTRALYSKNADYLLEHDPHAIYPTSIYRQASGHISSTEDSSIIEGVMATTITTTVQIVRDVLHPDQRHLRDIYKQLRRCVCIIDERVDGIYGQKIANYFSAHGIALEKLAYRSMEVDKDISTVERILVDLKARRVSRNEPVLVVGGGVMSDVGGFACALYHRCTPYVMLCTSIVSGIDAGPSPRTCCDGLGYKNVFGAYHPPVLTLTDRSFFRTLEPGWIRHGIAEIIKMAVVKDVSLFELLEKAGPRLVDTKFGVECPPGDNELDGISEAIVAKAMDAYVRSEYMNMAECTQTRPHAYGHTWSPGFELQAGLLHGHAVAIGMGYGAYLSFLEGWLSKTDFHRVLKLMSGIGLSLVHPIIGNVDSIWSAQLKMTEKRGGNLCAPLPRGGLGRCGYLNKLTRSRLEETLSDYRKICEEYPRKGLGIEPHCHDVGLEDPSTVKQHADNAVAMGSLSNSTAASTNGAAGTNGVANTNGTTKEPSDGYTSYDAWVASHQTARNAGATSSRLAAEGAGAGSFVDMEEAPPFPHASLFHDGAEEYALVMTTPASKDYERIVRRTNEEKLFAPCMVGQIEGQFLTTMAFASRAKRVLEIGTFTGYAALAFAEGLPADGKVVTVEIDSKCVTVARECFSAAKHGGKITVVEGKAREAVRDMVSRGEKYDIIFLDADKVNYGTYYEAGLQMLNDGGLIMADNALCSLVYAANDPVRKSLHEFNQMVRADARVEQVMLSVREGILVVRKVQE